MLSLWYFDQTLNIFSQIGMIMLIGLVTKNGILIVEFANQKRKLGMDKWQAVVEASTARMRPILMTSLAMALGALPIALSLGAAATSRIPLGIVIVGGILFSLLLTLFVIPAMYSFLSRKRGKGFEEMVGDTVIEAEKAVSLLNLIMSHKIRAWQDLKFHAVFAARKASKIKGLSNCRIQNL